MGTTYLALLGALGLGSTVLSIAFWSYVMTKGYVRFRQWVMRRFDVVISTGHRGHWRAEGAGSKRRLLAIELLPLAFFMAALFVWFAFVLIFLGIVNLVDAAYQ